MGRDAGRMEPVRCNDRLRRADVDTPPATAAMRAGRLIDRQGQVGIELAEKEVRAGAAIDQYRVLADPAEAGIACQCFFQHWCGIHISAVTEIADFSMDTLG